MAQSLITHLRHGVVTWRSPTSERQLAFYTCAPGAWPRSPATPWHRLSPRRRGLAGAVDILRAAQGPGPSASTWCPSARRAPQDVDALAGHLLRRGRHARRRALRPASAPRAAVTGLRFFDVDGRTVEVSADVATRAHRKVEEQEPIPVRLSHVVLNSTDSGTSGDRLLGTATPSALLAVGHPGAGRGAGHRHELHALQPQAPLAGTVRPRSPHVSLHHVSFELRGIDEFMRRATGAGAPFRHPDGLGSRPSPGRPPTHLLLLPRPEQQHHRVHHRTR